MTERPLRILFSMRAMNFDRVFEQLIVELLERGHEVKVVLSRSKLGGEVRAERLFDRISAECRRFTYDLLQLERDRTLRAATAVRHALDYLRFLEPEYGSAAAARGRARDRVPPSLRAAVDAFGQRGRIGRALMRRALIAAERAAGVPAPILDLMRSFAPDVVIVTPLVELGSWQGGYVRAAGQLGVPSVLAVASWDNLTSKGGMRDRPTLTIVWNDDQVGEAVRLHGIPRDRVTAVGAHTFDHWFTWQPSTTREEFCAHIGLDLDHPFILYLCSSGFIAGNEAEFVEEWLGRLRSSGHPSLEQAGVLVRPHPQNADHWADTSLEDAGQVAVWPRSGSAPVDAGGKAAYFDSLHHAAAVVGINTSAMVEAAIVRRGVFTILDERFRRTQEGTLHFGHLTGDGSGMVSVARDWAEHMAQLAAAFEDPEAAARRCDRFLATFVRPHGLDRRAAPIAADAIERAARTRVPQRKPRLHPIGRIALALALTALSGSERRHR